MLYVLQPGQIVYPHIAGKYIHPVKIFIRLRMKIYIYKDVNAIVFIDMVSNLINPAQVEVSSVSKCTELRMISEA